jgi:hypothetical protein
MTQVSCQIRIHAPVDAIWQVISDFGAACLYLSRVVNCTVEGQGIGSQRTLTSGDGSTIVERLETLDQTAHRLSYALLTDTPFRNCLTIMTVRELGPNLADVEWSATFEPDGLPVREAQGLLKGALQVNCLALKHFVEIAS